MSTSLRKHPDRHSISGGVPEFLRRGFDPKSETSIKSKSDCKQERTYYGVPQFHNVLFVAVAGLQGLLSAARSTLGANAMALIKLTQNGGRHFQ